jgi:hypothetical protein
MVLTNDKFQQTVPITWAVERDDLLQELKVKANFSPVSI